MNCEYKELIIETLESYPKYRHKHMLKEVCKTLNFTEENNNILESDEMIINVESNASDLQKLIAAVNNNEKSLLEVLKTDFKHSYKYSTILDLRKEDKVKFNEFIADTDKHLNSSQNRDQLLLKTIKKDYKPTYHLLDKGIHAFKFSKKITGYLPVKTHNEANNKYNILLIYFEKLNILEIRLDSISTHFKQNNNNNLYIDSVDEIVKWLKRNIKVECSPVNLSAIVDNIRKTKKDNVRVAAQEMRMRTGSTATLDIGINQDFILPILGELKEIIDVEKETFETDKNTWKIKSLLEGFILDKEETSDLPWITLIWDHDKKTRSLEVKFSFIHNKSIYDFMIYYRNNARSRRMNDVTKYLVQNRKSLSEETANAN